MVCKVTDVAKLGREDKMTTIFKREKHLLEQVLIKVVGFDQSPGCNKIEFVFEVIWEIL